MVESHTDTPYSLLQGKMRRRGSSSSTSLPQSRASTPAGVQNGARLCDPIVISSDDGDEVNVPPINIKSEAGAGQNGAVPTPKENASNAMVMHWSMNMKLVFRSVFLQPSINRPTPSWYDGLVQDSCEDQLNLSGKLMFLFELLEQTLKLKEKVLVFSQSLLTLDLIEEFLSKPQFGDWVPALDYYRLDGSTKTDIRTANMTEFNKTSNSRYTTQCNDPSILNTTSNSRYTTQPRAFYDDGVGTLSSTVTLCTCRLFSILNAVCVPGILRFCVIMLVVFIILNA